VSPDNILSYLSNNLITRIDFVDETLQAGKTNAVMTQSEYVSKLQKDNDELRKQLERAYETIGNLI
jgi:hypothetical protein